MAPDRDPSANPSCHDQTLLKYVLKRHLRLGALELLLAGAEIPSPLAPDDVRGDLKRAYEALFADNDSTPAPMGEL